MSMTHLEVLESCIERLENDSDFNRVITIGTIMGSGGTVTLSNEDRRPYAHIRLGRFNMGYRGQYPDTIWDVLRACLLAAVSDARVERDWYQTACDLWGTARVVNHGEVGLRGDGACIEIVVNEEWRWTTLPASREVWGERYGHRVTSAPIVCDDERDMVATITHTMNGD